MHVEDQAEFATRYVERLDRIGVERIEQRFAEISAAHDGCGLALLCFEPVGGPCHRHLFASWWEQQTGQAIRELGVFKTWAEVCEAVSELDEPPIRRCPRCSGLCYEVPRGVYNCSRCGVIHSPESSTMQK